MKASTRYYNSRNTTLILHFTFGNQSSINLFWFWTIPFAFLKLLRSRPTRILQKGNEVIERLINYEEFDKTMCYHEPNMAHVTPGRVSTHFHKIFIININNTTTQILKPCKADLSFAHISFDDISGTLLISSPINTTNQVSPI